MLLCRMQQSLSQCEARCPATQQLLLLLLLLLLLQGRGWPD
jgi:hypothetical protein